MNIELIFYVQLILLVLTFVLLYILERANNRLHQKVENISNSNCNTNT